MFLANKLTSVVLERPIGGQPLHRPCRLAPHNSVSLLVCHLSPLAANRHLTQCTTSHFVESKHRRCYNCENGVRNDAANQHIFLFFKIDRGERIKALSLLKSFSMCFSRIHRPSSDHAHRSSLPALYSWPERQHRTSHFFPRSWATCCHCIVSCFQVFTLWSSTNYTC